MDEREKTCKNCIDHKHSCEKERLHYRWIIGVLITIIIAILTYKFWGKQAGLELVDLISIGSGLVSIFLALIAIVYAFFESLKTSNKEKNVDIGLSKIIDNLTKMEEVLNKQDNKMDQVVQSHDKIKEIINDKLVTGYGMKGKESTPSQKPNESTQHHESTEKGKIIDNKHITIKEYDPTFRGKVYLADLSPVYGHELGGVRPVIVMSNEVNNRYSPVVTVIPVTAQINKAKLPTHVELGFLANTGKESVALADQVRTIDRGRLKELISEVDKETIKKINDALMIHMELISSSLKS